MAAPLEPPEPPVPVTVPVLNPGQMTDPLEGLAVPKAGATGAATIVKSVFVLFAAAFRFTFPVYA